MTFLCMSRYRMINHGVSYSICFIRRRMNKDNTSSFSEDIKSNGGPKAADHSWNFTAHRIPQKSCTCTQHFTKWSFWVVWLCSCVLWHQEVSILLLLCYILQANWHLHTIFREKLFHLKKKKKGLIRLVKCLFLGINLTKFF